MTYTVAIGLIVIGYVATVIFVVLMLYAHYHAKLAYLLPLLLAFLCAIFSDSGTVALNTRPTGYVLVQRANPQKYTPVEDQDGYYLYSWERYNRSEFHIYEWNGQAWQDTKHTFDNVHIVPEYLADGEDASPTVYSYDEALIGVHRFLFWDVPEPKAEWTKRYYFRIPGNKHYTEK